jgi:hypothetical protein
VREIYEYGLRGASPRPSGGPSFADFPILSWG